ncbi:MAG: TetR family transcriptional regulator [Geminicoccales bacterium]
MSQGTGKANQTRGQGLARLVPTQKRSKERFERILDCASEIIMEKGSDAFRMSDIVERSGIGFGSLYQYFPDKTAVIGTIAERHHEMGYVEVAGHMAKVECMTDFYEALCQIADGYYQFFSDHTMMGEVWKATQVDRGLQALNQEANDRLAALLTDKLQSLAPEHPNQALLSFSKTMLILIAAAVRHAIALPPKEARNVLDMFKQMLPKDLSLLDA